MTHVFGNVHVWVGWWEKSVPLHLLENVVAEESHLLQARTVHPVKGAGEGGGGTGGGGEI